MNKRHAEALGEMAQWLDNLRDSMPHDTGFSFEHVIGELLDAKNERGALERERDVLLAKVNVLERTVTRLEHAARVGNQTLVRTPRRLIGYDGAKLTLRIAAGGFHFDINGADEVIVSPAETKA